MSSYYIPKLQFLYPKAVLLNKGEVLSFKVACTTGLKCLYSVVYYFYRNFVPILIKPRINLFQKYTIIEGFSFYLLSKSCKHKHYSLDYMEKM